ncbi:hydroxymethylglutaryl-CoA lyase [Nafulsella turpanensis]|uniref:hydroxymethylglutaryl-CoA lyase n=1 Tax=Nafulsella turpanensis TaxID=1265690 RepID=UPI00034C13D3|nr:hydroxymethylglutaryl-CoA lyase [Nafulsella turpanensis]
MAQDSKPQTQNSGLKIIECPRDAMQGYKTFIPTEKKVAYINALLQVGFDTIDFGSFVSPKAIPQMRDTAEVLAGLDLRNSRSKLLAIVANYRGAEDAVRHPEINYLGFPLSLSETFQQRNTNKSIAEALQVVEDIQNLSQQTGKELVTYLSMGFGNPYGDPYDVGVVEEFTEKLSQRGIRIISLADTIASASPAQISELFDTISRQFPDNEVGVHLHSLRSDAYTKIDAAYRAGCRRIDGALLGFGGCPMAKDELVGNLPTEELIRYIAEENISHPLNEEALQQSLKLAREIFVM